MEITLRQEHPTDEASAKAATGRTLGEWFAHLDGRGGPSAGRRAIGMHLANELKLDPWWASTITVGYESAHGLVEKDGRARGYSICATKSVKATPAACHAAFTDAGALDAWFGSGHAGDVVDGGEIRNADGNRALVRKVNPGKTIKLVWQQPDAAPDTPVEIKFQAAGAKTTVMVTHERLQTRAEADGLRRAWGEALDRLKTHLESD